MLAGEGGLTASRFLNGKTELDVEEGSHEQNDKHLPAAAPMFPGPGWISEIQQCQFVSIMI